MFIRALLTGSLLAIAAASTSVAQRDFSEVEIETKELVDGVYMLTGAGGNMGLSTGADGAFLIDDQFAPLSDKIMAAIDAVSDDQPAFVVNTHFHYDHTGGNEAFGKSGAHIVAHDNVRTRLKDGFAWSDGETQDRSPAVALPVITFADAVTFHWNGREIYVWHPGPAHTDGDAVVFFDDDAVVHMGDTFFNGAYPFVDVDSGGTLNGAIATHEAVLARINDETLVIPGHGPLARKADLEKTTALLKDVRARVQAQIDAGLDEDAAVAADPLADLNPVYGQGFISGEAMVRAAYKSLAPR